MRSTLYLILLVLLGALPSFAPVAAAAAVSPLAQAEQTLVKASADKIDISDQKELLENALALLQSVPGGKGDQGHLDKAMKYTQLAITDIDNNEEADTLKQDISGILDEVRTTIKLVASAVPTPPEDDTPVATSAPDNPKPPKPKPAKHHVHTSDDDSSPGNPSDFGTTTPQ